MKYLSVMAGCMFILTGLITAAPLSDQEMHGVDRAVTVPAQAGDRTLIETGGFPAPEPNSPIDAEIDVTSNTHHPGIIQRTRPVGNTNPDWGYDVQVINDTLATDPFLLVTADGTLYVVYKYMGPAISANSSVTICRSTNNGTSWSWILDASVDDTTEIYNLDVILENETDSTFIYAICNAQGDDIWILRYNVTANSTDWVEVTVGSVYDPAIDQLRSTTSKYLYMAYCVYDTDLRFRVSSNYGATWSASYDVDTSGVHHNPDIIMTVADSIWMHICWDNGPVVYSKANDYVGFGGWISLPRHTHNFRGGSDDVNAQLAGNYHSDTVWVVAEENLDNTGDWNLVWDYTYDGTHWRCDTLFPAIDLASDPSVDEQYFKLLAGWNTTDQARVAYNVQTSPSDTRVDYQFCMNGSWTATTALSNYLAKAGTSPTVNYADAAGGGVIAYCGYNAVWYDYFWNTAIQEYPVSRPRTIDISLFPTIAADVARLSFTSGVAGKVNVTMYDAAGRTVSTLADETMSAGDHSINIEAQKLAAGIYFVRVQTPDGIGTRTMTVVR